MRFLRELSRQALRHRYGAALACSLTAAAVTGAVCVVFMRAFEWVLARRLSFESLGGLRWAATPALFLISVELIQRVAPLADGAGIPQAIFAARHMDPASEKRLFPLVSLRTMLVKAAALLLGLWAGASTGREGPTVHVAACAFVGVMVLFRRALGLSFDPRSAVVAGGAAGLAAAFNTPLAGVTFAIEELSGSYFASIKDSVLMAIIVAAIAAKAMTGEYGYFGRLQDAPDVPVRAVVLIGLLGGALGAFFSTAIVWGRRRVSSLNGSWGRWAAPPLLAVGLLLLARRGGGWMEGPGNGAAQALLTGAWAPWALAFPLTKMAATLFTYWSGIAGGIFAPCLAIGAALGSDLSLLAGGSANACALVGMAAFLAGTIQAPMTAFVIIFEMTGQHQMLLPVMLGSLLAFMTARVLRAKHLYDSLASSYSWLLVS